MPDIEPKKPLSFVERTSWIKSARTSTLIQMLIHTPELLRLVDAQNVDEITAAHAAVCIEIDRRLPQATGFPQPEGDGPHLIVTSEQ